MRCGCSVADPPDDPVVVEAMREVAERLVELLVGAESVQPAQLLLQGREQSPDAGTTFGLAAEGRARLNLEGLELALEGVRDELAGVLLAALRPGRAVAFADEGCGCEYWDDVLVGETQPRASHRRDLLFRTRQRLVTLEDDAGEPPRAAVTQNAVELLRGGRDRLTTDHSRRGWPPRWRTASVLEGFDLLLETLDLHGLDAVCPIN